MHQSRIVVVGSNHEYAPVHVREQIAFSGEALDAGLVSLGAHLPEGLILSTCNRTEIYAVAPESIQAEDEIFAFLHSYHSVPDHLLRRSSYVHEGHEAINHLFRVASGLDSLVLGEPQILSQIRDALSHARAAGVAGPVLQRLATEALRTGKKARTETDIARNRVSIAHAAVDLADLELGGIAGKHVLVLGAGKMATLTAKLVKARGAASITVVNRSLTRAQELASAVGGLAVPITGLTGELRTTDVVFGAATVDEPLIVPDLLEGRTADLWMIDIAVPRVIDQACGLLPGIHVRDVDALESVAAETRRLFASEVNKVESLVGSAVAEFDAWTRSRQAATAIARLQVRADAIRTAELERAMRKLTHLSPRDQNVIRAMAVGLTNKLIHDPVQALRTAETDDDRDQILATFGLPEP